MTTITILSQPQTTTVVGTGQPTILLQVDAGVQGPPGPQGPAGGTAITAPAAQALGGHRAVVLNASGAADYADCTTPAHMGRFAGITAGAASAGQPVTIINAGPLTEPTWAWTPDAPVYLASSGLISQTPPATGFLQIIGMTLSATTLFVSPREPLALL